ncbi:NAD(P)-dependent oxidoreductase [Reticulibacter mediterranei]|uniref:NAD(P)-dependent oxidoreductase n=1 Tax=Reticulibacter mediterranei TaxID=2778369 RepID=A0A8J3IAY3_9CHLR|nr:SDR family oxidoreductase [Reticulibacter mediterranei]GHO90258.1 NAD(P)-dependent oxidoreductase [Reticulibacter mediterranei]
MILIPGATGLTGTALVHEFRKHHERVHILTRDAKHATMFEDDPNIEIAVGDMLKPETLDDAFKSVDKAVLLSTADPVAMAETQIAFINAAKKAGVRHIVKLSCLNPDKKSPARFLRMHAEIEKHLEDSGLTWTHIRPAHFMQMYLLDAPTVIAQDAFFNPLGDAFIAPIDVYDLVKVFYVVLTTGGHEGKMYELSGPDSMTMNDIAELFSKALGRTIHYVNVTLEQERQQLVSFGMPEQLADAVNELYSERCKGSESKVLLETQKLFGIRPTPFAEFVAQHVEIFQGIQTAHS